VVEHGDADEVALPVGAVRGVAARGGREREPVGPKSDICVVLESDRAANGFMISRTSECL
jgi:hypothetical protein